MAKRGKNRPLTTEIKGNELVITIGVNTLAFAFEHSDDNNPWNGKQHKFIRTWKVTDIAQFAKDVMYELLSEEEDGSSPLSNFFDRACQNALNEGSIGIDSSGEESRG